MKKHEVLEEAGRLISEDRQQQYGKATDNFGRIAEMWSAYAGINFTKADVAAMMALMKLARLANQHKDDSWIDLAGYAALGAELAEEDDV